MIISLNAAYEKRGARRHALVRHFDGIDLSNKSVPPDVLGRACEYLVRAIRG